MLSAKPKCMFTGTALGKTLLKMGTMLTVTMLKGYFYLLSQQNESQF
jgi:hypothetical protein